MMRRGKPIKNLTRVRDIQVATQLPIAYQLRLLMGVDVVVKEKIKGWRVIILIWAQRHGTSSYDQQKENPKQSTKLFHNKTSIPRCRWLKHNS